VTPEDNLSLIAYADGAARGNPGPSSYGVVVYDDAGVELYTGGKALGHGTNNQAEYEGAIAALEAALQLGAANITLRLDSLLVARQLTGQYRVKNAKLKPLHKRLVAVGARFRRLTVEHVPREENKVADRMANEALDALS
jgi:ribonuclease HI